MLNKIILVVFEQQRPKRLTDVVTGDETTISFCGMPSKRASMVLIDEAEDGPVVLRPGFQNKKRLFSILFNHTEPLVVDILPEWKKRPPAARQEQYCLKLQTHKRLFFKNAIY